jgi:predicted MPP superfamily phosphohydrolase
MDQLVLDGLHGRLGSAQLMRRLALEHQHEARMSARRSWLFGIRRWYSPPWIVRTALRCSGLYARAQKNAERVQVRHNLVRSHRLPGPFDGLTILQISDLHADMNQGAMGRLAQLLPTLEFDICVLTGDYRGKTYGPFEATLDALARVRVCLPGPVYGVLGNHDTIHMVTGLEEIGIRMLLNESAVIVRRGEEIHLAGVDDAHHFGTHDLEKAAAAIPAGRFSILLSHTPEIYRQAGEAGFDLLLAGHTHGGQICLPGSIPVTLDADLPRRMGAGAWKYQSMAGYTSVGVGTSIVAARLNCPPEITLHRLVRADTAG